MMGYSDIFESRRTMFETAEWWSLKKLIGPDGKPDLTKIGHSVEPTGSFFCEETNAPVESPNQIGNIRYTGRMISLITSDDIMDKIFKDDIVRYDGRFWRVHSITMQREWRRSQFVKGNRDGTKIITLRG